MHDNMQYDPIQGQGHTQALESLKSFHFQQLYQLPFTMTAGNWPLILKLGHNIYIWSGRIFFIFVLVFVSRDFELGRNVSCEESTVSPARC